MALTMLMKKKNGRKIMAQRIRKPQQGGNPESIIPKLDGTS